MLLMLFLKDVEERKNNFSVIVHGFLLLSLLNYCSNMFTAKFFI